MLVTVRLPRSRRSSADRLRSARGQPVPAPTVTTNVGFALRSRQGRGPRISELLEVVRAGRARAVSAPAFRRAQQRVALARALAIPAHCRPVGEPFASLDTHLRASVRPDVQRISRGRYDGPPVTHDQSELFRSPTGSPSWMTIRSPRMTPRRTSIPGPPTRRLPAHRPGQPGGRHFEAIRRHPTRAPATRPAPPEGGLAPSRFWSGPSRSNFAVTEDGRGAGQDRRGAG